MNSPESRNLWFALFISDFTSFPPQLQAELREYRPKVDGNLETSALGLTFRVTKQGGGNMALFCD